MENKIKYLKEKFLSGLFNVSKICKVTGISNPTIYKIINGKGNTVRPYIINTLYDYIQSIGN